MADKMLRMAGRGDDGKAKALKTDNEGNLGVQLTGSNVEDSSPLPLKQVASKPLETTHHDGASSSGSGTLAYVDGYGTMNFQIYGSFTANVYFEGLISGGRWRPIRATKENGTVTNVATEEGIYKINVSGFKLVRARLEWVSGTSITVNSLATFSSIPKELSVKPHQQNKVLFSMEDNWQIGKNLAFYGNFSRGSTFRSDLTPVDYSDYSKKSVYVVNNFDVDMRIIYFNKHINVSKKSGGDKMEAVPVEIVMSANGGVGRLSPAEYPELNDPFLGLTVDIQAVSDSPSTGNIKIHWLGGNN